MNLCQREIVTISRFSGTTENLFLASVVTQLLRTRAHVCVCAKVCVCVCMRLCTHLAEHVLSRLLPTFNLIHLAVTSIMAK